MTEKETIEMNELISDFMGLNENNGYHTHPSPARGFCRPIHLQYNHNWNWFMSAWYVFRDIKFEKEIDQFRHSDLKGLIAGAICYDNIEIAFHNLCNAVKWHNSKQ